MEFVALVLSVLSLAGLLVAGLFLRGFLPSYVYEKGKNAASKEDLALRSALNHFIELQVEHTARPGSVDQARMKESYTAVVIAMRRDVGFPDTAASASDYKFVKF